MYLTSRRYRISWSVQNITHEFKKQTLFRPSKHVAYSFSKSWKQQVSTPSNITRTEKISFCVEHRWRRPLNAPFHGVKIARHGKDWRREGFIEIPKRAARISTFWRYLPTPSSGEHRGSLQWILLSALGTTDSRGSLEIRADHCPLINVTCTR